MDLCPYKYALGVPGEGIHSYRLFGVAIMDVLMTILGGILLSYMFNMNAFVTTGGLFLLGILLHRAFCVRTKLDTLLFP